MLRRTKEVKMKIKVTEKKRVALKITMKTAPTAMF